jgi:hypothetical protein
MNPHGNVIHGQSKTLTYSRWKSMMQRCADPKQLHYARYGGAGVTVCERWQDFASFLTDMGECPSRAHTLDRTNGGDYEPGNCRWITKAEQNRNRPKAAVMLTHNGATKSVTDWAAEVGIAANTLFHRVKLGWSHDRVLTTPLKSRGAR